MPDALRKDEVRVTNRFGQTLIINKEVASSFRRHGVLDWLGIAVIEFVLTQRKQALTLDVGANIGNHTLVMARFAHKVYAFEPQVATGIRLADNVRLNGLTNVDILPYGLADKDEAISLFVATDGIGGATTYVKDSARSNAQVVMSQVRNGDRALDEIGVDAVDFIKIDVEGFEFNALSGLQRHIQKSRPIVLMEWNHEKTIRDFNDGDGFARLFPGYRTFAVVDSFDKRLWGRAPMQKLRRGLAKLMRKRSPCLAEFSPAAIFNNILLVPEEQGEMIAHLEAQFGKPRQFVSN
jgi:FkbM family methyltransferase